MKALLVSGIVLMLVATLALAASITNEPARRGICLTRSDVLWHQQTSRSGESLTCNEAIRQRDADQEAVQ